MMCAKSLSFAKVTLPSPRSSLPSFGPKHTFKPSIRSFNNTNWGINNFKRFYGTDHHHGSNPHITPYPEEIEEPHKVKKSRWQFTREEVAKHCTKEDCWIIIHGKVYDVSEWILFHPGLDKIATNAGYDSTELFEAVGHTSAVEYMDKFYIGDIVDSEKHRRFTCNTPTEDPDYFY